ncbi:MULTISPECIES: glycosyltransferase family 39 protein [unclassified Bifidobacterium]|uniref:glycosyltransferase family 39 protein n=1 Tax=unclassified Bifidobacterium TaxID=2608897 RepID=UPI003F936CFD
MRTRISPSTGDNTGESTHNHSHWIRDERQFVTIAAKIAIFVILPALFLGIYQSKLHGRYSNIDEPSHASYAWSVSHGHIPAKGDPIEEPILDDLSCAGQSNTENIPKCGTHAPLSKYPLGGTQYNFIHPPIYYAITGTAARIISHFIPSMTFVHAARLLQIVWVIIGIMLCFYSLRAWGVRETYALSGAAIIPYIPVVCNAGSAINNDAPALACGAAILWCMARIYRNNKYDWVPIVMALLFCSMKGTFAFGFLGLSIILFIQSMLLLYTGDRRKGTNGAILAVSVAAASVFCVIGWSKFQSIRGASDWSNPNASLGKVTITGTPLGEIMTTLFAGLNLANFDGQRGLESQPASIMWVAVLAVILVGSLGFLYFQHDNDQSHMLLIATVAVSMLMFPTLIQIREFLSNGHMFLYVTPRYGMYLIPLVLCCWVLALQNRRSKILAVSVPVFAIVCSFFAVATATNLN